MLHIVGLARPPAFVQLILMAFGSWAVLQVEAADCIGTFRIGGGPAEARAVRVGVAELMPVTSPAPTHPDFFRPDVTSALGLVRGSESVHLARDIAGTDIGLQDTADAVAAPERALRLLAGEPGLRRRPSRTGIILATVPAALVVRRDGTDPHAALDSAPGSPRTANDLSGLRDRWLRAPTEPITDRERVALSLAGAVGLAGLGYFLCVHFIVLTRCRAALTRARRLEEAADTIDSMLLVLDPEMRVVWWNEAYIRNRPWQKDALKRGVPLETLIANSLRAGKTERRLPVEEAEREAAEQVQEIRRGTKVVRRDFSADGRIFERRSTALSNGEFAIVAQDVTTIAHANAELVETSGRLRDAVEQLETFNRIAAHDLVAPLRSIRTLNRWIREDITDLGVALATDTAESIDQVGRLTQRLCTMIDDLLEFSKPAHDILPLAFCPAARFEGILEIVAPPDGFRVSLPDGVPPLLANPVAFDIVLRNLISNAVKHHDQGCGEIRVRCHVERSFCIFDVLDDGPGIPARFRDTVFEPLTTLRSRDEGAGTGLGLSFALRAVQQWGGTIAVLDNPDGRGTCIRFTVPRAVVEQDDA